MMASNTRYHSYFLQRLPNNVHTILASTSNTTSLDELAQLADKIVDVVSQTLHLEAVNHTPIQTYGTQLLTLNLGLRCTFCWAFTVADVRKPMHHWRQFPAPLQPAGGRQTPSAPRWADATPRPRHYCTRLLAQPGPATLHVSQPMSSQHFSVSSHLSQNPKFLIAL